MPTSPTTEITMTGPVARAVARATTEFLSAGHGAIDRFEVIVTTGADTCEVIFVPEPDPGATTRGGQSSAGREMHFWVSTADGELLKSSFAR
ncbi:MAG: hypothetical protein ACJ8GJ_22960 [Vitreoscilla sp.]